MSKVDVAIIDYGLGNLFSIKHACEYVGLSVKVTNDAEEVLRSSSIILPGVGAYGDAMESLQRLDLIDAIKEGARRGTPLLGICLGLQLLFTESEEFGAHRGLDLIPGRVSYFPLQEEGDRILKVPHVGWNAITPPNDSPSKWENTILNGFTPGTEQYFVHSCYVIPENEDTILTTTRYGGTEFCSAVYKGNITALQFHPERSGQEGLIIYNNFAALIREMEVK